MGCHQHTGCNSPFPKKKHCWNSHGPSSISVPQYQNIFCSQIDLVRSFSLRFVQQPTPCPPNSILSHDRIRHKKQQLRYICLILIFYYQRSLLRNPIGTSIRTGKIFTKEILNAHPWRVLEILRMPMTTFLDLCDWVSLNTNLQSIRSVSLKEQLMCFLWIISHNSSNHEAQEQFQHSRETISRHFQLVLRGMLALYKTLVRLPHESTPTRIRNDWGKM